MKVPFASLAHPVLLPFRYIIYKLFLYSGRKTEVKGQRSAALQGNRIPTGLNRSRCRKNGRTAERCLAGSHGVED